MKIVGLTGGIGSGKTTVAAMFSELGVPVYIADIEARALTNRSKVIKRKIIELLGNKSFKDQELDRDYVAGIVFKDSEKLEALNSIIHPRVARHFKKWVAKQDGEYCIKEAAILFENGGYKQCDATILVTAPEEIRITRVLQRDTTTKQAIQERMNAQWTDAKKIKLATYCIENINLEATQKEVKKIHKKLSLA
ncbi:dephospho-CoA kinase [Jejudonia soesokkakensis]|uniref:Dephospho-CoA kinase n=1 Tax=Jejudonia soesokkakensis TaxID=1323432 RepID=A0ABW2MYC9_9FLAO